MIRRSFLQKLGIGVPSFIVGQQALAKSKYQWHPFHKLYPEINTLQDAKTQDGQIILRIAIESRDLNKIADFSGKIQVKGGKLNRTQSYFFEAGEDSLDADSFATQTSLDNLDVLVIWLDESSENTELTIGEKRYKFSFQLNEIVTHKELHFEPGNNKITVNFLLDKEIGEIDPKDVNISSSGDDFRFAIMADPQGGDPTDPSNGSNTRIKIHNAFVEESVELVNNLPDNPLFTIMVGDIVDHQGQWTNYQAMLSFFEKLKTPILFSVGNHETRYQAKFSPGYNMEEFTNYFNAQKQVNGMGKMLYSFNLGQWHFVVWPDPLRPNFWETHPHYFDWLEHDLEKYKDQPVMFFHHVPLTPVGINPLINYVEQVSVKRKVIDILGKHGNVQYAISGHVHIPLKASVKNACSFKGIRFINLPAAGYRPRAFGEEDFYGGPTQGIAIVHIKGKAAEVQYQNATREIYTYQKELPDFDPKKWPLWLSYKWELPATANLQNGNFQQGLVHWAQRYVYKEDENPSNICEIQRNVHPKSQQSLFMYCRKRGYDIPGQDRLPQTINRICQVINIADEDLPSLSMNLKINQDHYRKNSFNGAYIWIEGFEKYYKRLNLVYSVNKMYYNIGGNYSDVRTVKPIHFDLDISPDKWHSLNINIHKDFQEQENILSTFTIDRLVINLGVWTVNDGDNQQIGVYFDDLSLHRGEENSNLDGQLIARKKEEDFWYGGIDHVAGEHQYKTEA